MAQEASYDDAVHVVIAEARPFDAAAVAALFAGSPGAADVEVFHTLDEAVAATAGKRRALLVLGETLVRADGVDKLSSLSTAVPHAIVMVCGLRGNPPAGLAPGRYLPRDGDAAALRETARAALAAAAG